MMSKILTTVVFMIPHGIFGYFLAKDKELFVSVSSALFFGIGSIVWLQIWAKFNEAINLLSQLKEKMEDQ